MPFKPHYTDISGKTISAGDNLIIWNPPATGLDKEVRHDTVVDSVERISDTVRKLKLTLITSTSPSMKQGLELEYELDASRPQMGLIIKSYHKDATEANLTRKEMEDHMIISLRKYLDNKAPDFRDTSANCIKFLESNSFMDEGLAYRSKRNKLTRLISLKPDVFRSTGMYIESTGKPLMSESLVSQNAVNTQFSVADFSKFMIGWKMILESGVLGQMKLTGFDYIKSMLDTKE